MAISSQAKYSKLSGRGRRKQGIFAPFQPSCTLWLADDHILNIDNSVFTEAYKRFYFRDIQAIIVQHTNRGKIWNIILALLMGFSLIVLFGQKSRAAMIFWLTMTGIFGIFLLVNWLRGPTCHCQITTAVQQDSLPSLNRIRTAEKVIRILKRQIQHAQADLSIATTHSEGQFSSPTS